MPTFSPMPNESDFMSYILGDVFKKLTNGGDPKMLGPNNFIAWEPVPVVIDPEAFDYALKGFFGATPKIEGMTDEEYTEARNSKKYSKYAHAEEFARLADQIPSMIPELDGNGARKFTIFSPHPDHTKSNVYQDVMEYCVVKNTKIDPKVEKKLETLRKDIVTVKKLKNPDYDDSLVEHPEDNPKFIFQSFPSPQYVKYLEYEALYYEAEDKLTDLQKRVADGEGDAMSEMAINGRNYIKRRDDALKRWEGIGYKGKIEKSLNYIDEIESSNFITIKKRYESELLAAKRTGLGGMNTYFFSQPVPASTLANSTKWLEYKFSKSDYESNYQSTSHSWSAAASFAGLFSVGAAGKHKRINSNFNFNDFEMSFKIGKCYVSSPWLGTTFLKSRYWKYSKNGADILNNQMISDGNGKGLLPAVATEFYFITDLKIGFKKGSDSYKKTEDEVKAGGALAIGPFVLGGSYGYDDERVNRTGSRESQGMSSGGILLLGRKCNIIDLSPNPLPSIKDDEWVEVN
ncbi:hypothetical protein [Flavobacterium terrigena]|uniref:Uncharacterized protein n=1 Tax=Flavobacterium terrigena TaxID=402734 RepID=A0A1H6VDP0_9FLAO|nr:hypothetical protein [Flavobacterium terrigena]SEJ02749.1 hypothetical protein SAMN05660918_2199 [Flavobacterium terrigena]